MEDFHQHFGPPETAPRKTKDLAFGTADALGYVAMDHQLDHYREAEVKIGDHVRRRGLLAEMFGDEEGTVVDVRHHDDSEEFEVKFGTRRVVYSSQQIVLC